MVDLPPYNNGRKLIYTWVYKDKDGKPLGRVARYQDGSGSKAILPFFKPNGEAGIDLKPRPLFGLDKLASQPKNKVVCIAEGEKSATALHSLKFCAVTSLGGAHSAKLADWTSLNGYETVHLFPDNDDAGEKYVRDVCDALSALETPPVMKIVRLQGLPPGGDVVDWLQSRQCDTKSRIGVVSTSKEETIRVTG